MATLAQQEGSAGPTGASASTSGSASYSSDIAATAAMPPLQVPMQAQVRGWLWNR